MSATTILDLASTFVVVQPDHAAVAVPVTPTIFAELDEKFDHFKGRFLLSAYTFDADWSSWEAHPAGDEIVCLLSGDVTLVLDRNGKHEEIRLSSAGDFVIVPQGTWHTARTTTPTKLLFLTPGEGTQNKPV